MSSLADVLETVGASLERSLERLNVAVYLVDSTGRIRWQNAAAVALVGAKCGSHFASVLAPEYLHVAQQAFTRKVLGTEGSVDREMVVLGPNGQRTRVVTNGVPVEGSGGVVGVFGLARVVAAADLPPLRAKLTPRQFETLRLLAAGHSTAQIAAQLGIAHETARGHVRRLLSALDAHSRLEAVARGRELGLV